jgi:hypothetical protein
MKMHVQAVPVLDCTLGAQGSSLDVAVRHEAISPSSVCLMEGATAASTQKAACWRSSCASGASISIFSENGTEVVCEPGATVSVYRDGEEVLSWSCYSPR